MARGFPPREAYLGSDDPEMAMMPQQAAAPPRGGQPPPMSGIPPGGPAGTPDPRGPPGVGLETPPTMHWYKPLRDIFLRQNLDGNEADLVNPDADPAEVDRLIELLRPHLTTDREIDAFEMMLEQTGRPPTPEALPEDVLQDRRPPSVGPMQEPTFTPDQPGRDRY